MKKLIVLFALVLLFAWQLSAQIGPGKLKFGLLGGYAFYSQDDLKFVNQDILNQLPFDTRMIDEFEPVLYVGAYTRYGLSGHFCLGPEYEYHSTGSRLGVRDYSGMYSFDQYVHMHQLGLGTDYVLIQADQLFLHAEMSVGARFTGWKTDSNLEIGDNGEYTNRQVIKLKGLSWYVTPALRIGYEVISPVSLTGAIAYSFDLDRNYAYENNKDLTIVKSPDWSGLKLSIGIEFRLK